MVTALKINELVFHGIVRKTGPDVEPQLSDIATPIPDRALAFLEEQIADAFRHGRPIVEDPSASKVPDIIREHWTGGSDLLACSRKLATLLQADQPAQAPGGLLMVANATVNSKQHFLVAKLEHQRGTQATPTYDTQGRLTFDVAYLDQLIFTQRSRVHKIGSFPISNDPSKDRLAGIVVDQQAPAHHVARYFREDFLGCIWTNRPEEATAKFFDGAQKWIDTLDDPDKQSRYQIALIAEMQGPGDTLSVSNFASSRIESDDRDEFVAHMRTVVPALDMPKSIEYVRSQLANVRYDTEKGVIVMAPPDRLKDGTVTVESDDDGQSTLQVHDRITKTSGHGTFKP